MMTPAPLPTNQLIADVCVIGGGMPGLAAALSAARHGARVVLMHERPVLGGNASSEIRVHVCGADRHNNVKNMRETGILEEIRLENLRRNPQRSFSVWDTVLYEKARFQPGLTLLLNCSCLDAEMDGATIASVTGWQLTTQSYQRVQASIYIDCSGDAILAPLTGAHFRMGREGRAEFNENIAPEIADARTMGMTCLFQTRQHATPQPFSPPSWAHRYTDDAELPYGANRHRWFEMGYWWVELGGEGHSIYDTEHLRDELLKIAYGLWDHIKNHGDHGAENWALEWLQFLPGKRESRRYVGAHVLCQPEIEAEGRFDDLVAYGGWSMDDHHPSGFHSGKLGVPSTIFHHAPSPYGIPYRALYSRNIDNLMFAGRCASCTHAAMSSTRVMGTGMTMGAAAGSAAALATQRGLRPRDMCDAIDELQQLLLYDDHYLPGIAQRFSPATMQATLSASQGDPEPVRDGINRPVGDDAHAWTHRESDWLVMRLSHAVALSSITLLLDSGLDLNIALSYHQADDQLTAPPPPLPKAYHLDMLQHGEWRPLLACTDNHQRLQRHTINCGAIEAVRYTLDATWGGDSSRLYAMYVE